MTDRGGIQVGRSCGIFCICPLARLVTRSLNSTMFGDQRGACFASACVRPPRRQPSSEAVLIEHIARSADPAVAYAHSVLESGASVAEASSRVGLLPKTFVRRFREQVGLAPKQLSRVRRLQRILASIHRPADVDWCQVAAQHGYTDQAHLIHDFRDLTGVTPTAYRPSSPQRRNHVPLSPVA